MWSKGNLMVDALLGLLVVMYCIGIVGICIKSVGIVDKQRNILNVWQIEENTCEIWCK